MRAQEREVATLLADLTFALSVDEATHPVMRQSLEAGVADALGLASEMVTVTHIAGNAVTTTRRLAEVAISFEIQSASPAAAQVQALRETIIEAATEGSIVANVQKKAVENGVLTADLQGMDRVMTSPALTESTTVVTVYESALTAAPTPGIIASEDGSGSPVIIIVVVLAVIGIGGALYRMRTRSQAARKTLEVHPGPEESPVSTPAPPVVLAAGTGTTTSTTTGTTEPWALGQHPLSSEEGSDLDLVEGLRPNEPNVLVPGDLLLEGLQTQRREI
jgi:hypothetical protein